MDAAFAGAPARFRPTWQQALGHGLYVGGLISVVGVGGALIAAVVAVHWAVVPAPPDWVWLLLAAGPPMFAGPIGLLLGRRQSVVVDAAGIRTVAPFTHAVEPWNTVVDLRAERRGGRTVVSVYLDTGASVQLRAPYSGGMFAADPQFELKVGALSHLWRSHRFGGVPC
ncbi:hypothetical protein [Krasilnikovia sp. MM14-A1259]|uniref:hypothetical protein n=1 Tax=Krasilnikovia sp. MM14-A1259 TaxID=3373539 RepID=UPI00381455DA